MRRLRPAGLAILGVRPIRVVLTAPLLCGVFLIGLAIKPAHAWMAPAGADPAIAGIQLADISGQPLANASLRLEIIPEYQGTWGNRPFPLAALGTTDASGHMLLNPVVPASHPVGHKLRSDSGIVNDQVWLTAPNGLEVPVTTFARYYGSDANMARLHAIAPHQVRLVPQAAQDYRHALAQARTVGTIPRVTCQSYWETTSQANYWTTVGEFYFQSWANDGYFRYGNEADSTIGVSFSSNQTYWSNSGTYSVSNTLSGWSQQDTSSTYTVANHMQALFLYDYQRQWNDCDGWHNYWRIIADSWAGGGIQIATYEGQFDNQPNNWTTKMFPYNQYTKNAASAYTYGIGVTAFGVGLSSQSGYSQYTEEYWHTTTGSGCLYGNNANPQNAQLVYSSPSGC